VSGEKKHYLANLPAASIISRVDPGKAFIGTR